LTHVVWGFINTKTYNIVLLLHLCDVGFRVPVVIWLVDAYLGLSCTIAKMISKYWMHWLQLFYHQHRMAHLPKVYEHAHKLHHYLHGTMSFDAHIYGNGMPEEIFFMLAELCLAVFGRVTPAFLNQYIIYLTWTNKFGHTQKPEDTCGENFHTDHHIFHVKNFGIYNAIMDMYFSTATYSDKYKMKPGLYDGRNSITYTIQKTVENHQVKFTFTPMHM